MDSFVSEIVRQVPALGVLAWIVYSFLKHIREGDSARGKVLRDISDQCHRVQDRSIDALDRNTEALGAVKSTLDRINGVAKL